MDNLTHSLFGLTLARTPLVRASRGVTAALVLASNAPDIDIVTSAGGLANYLAWHRGPTHGPLGVVFLGGLAALLVSGGDRLWQRWRGTSHPCAPLLHLWLVSILGVFCHVLMDLPTSYGTRPFSPFSWIWYAEDWMPIVDVYLLFILASGLVLGRRLRPDGTSMRQRNAWLALALMGGLYGVRAVSHHQALQAAPGVFGGSLPAPCADAVPQGGWIDWWPRPTALGPRDRGATRCLIEVAAVPDFLSPFRWRLIAQFSNAYEMRDVDLLSSGDQTGRRLGIHYPNQWTPAVLQAAEAPVAQIFLGFSRFPAARSITDREGTTTVRWADMRFVGSPLGDERPRTGGMFGATVRVGAEGQVVDERLGP